MALFEWNDDYSVNVRSLDEQHKNLVRMLNELHDSLQDGTGQPALRETIEKIFDYTAYHFVSEERLLEKAEYPDYQRHKIEHDSLTWQVLDLRSRYERGENVGAQEVLDFLTGWLKNHILKTDKRYGIYLNSKGIH